MRKKRSNPDFLNGVPELLILSLLSRRPMYGYELIQAIRQATNGTVSVPTVALGQREEGAMGARRGQLIVDGWPGRGGVGRGGTGCAGRVAGPHGPAPGSGAQDAR